MATKVKTGVIDSGAITSALITDASITADDLHTTLDLTGKTVTVATASASDNDTSVASTAYVTTAIANLADSAPSTLNTLNELAAALGDDANFSTTVTNSIATKLPLAGGSLTGDLLMRNGGNIELGGYNSGNDKGLILSPQDGSGYWHVYNTAGGHLAFGASNTIGSSEKMRITGSGNVGIGRPDPTQLLEVHKSSGGDQTVAKISAHNYGDTGKTFIEIGTEYGDGSSRIGSFNDTGNSSVLVFDTHSATSGQFTERMRIASSGNVGIGTTPSVHYTGYEALDIGNTLSLMSNNTSTNISTLTNNGYLNSNASNWVRKVQDESTMYDQVSGQHRFKSAGSDSAGSAITWLERMRIDSTGRVGINRTPAIANSKLEIGGAEDVRLIVVEASGHTGGMGIKGGTGADKGLKLFSGGQIKIELSDQTNVAYTADGLFHSNARPSRYKTNGSGEMVLGYRDHGSGLYQAAMGLSYDSIDGLGNTAYRDAFVLKETSNGGQEHFRVSGNGNVANTNNSYGQISDERLKTDITDASSQWDDIKAVRVRKFNFVTAPEGHDCLQIGVISQELEASGMGGLIEESDPDSSQLAFNPELVGQQVKTVKYSVLYMKAIKALQEAMTRIEALEARVTELE